MLIRITTLAVLVCCGLVPTAGPVAAPPDGDPPTTSSAPLSPEEALWQEALTLVGEPTTTQPYAAWFQQNKRKHEALAEKLRTYLTLYPGGRHRVEAVRLELTALFELGSLRGGSYAALRRRLNEHLSVSRPEDPVEWEAAYWDILCQRLERAAAATQPVPDPAAGPDSDLLAAYRAYIDRYPRSPRVPAMAATLFDDATRAGGREQMATLAALLVRNFPDHALTAALEAQWRRERTVGHPFWLTFEQSDGSQIDTREWVGRPVLIVVWSNWVAEARERAAQVEAYRQSHPELAVVGVNLDIRREDMDAACRDLGLSWPQYKDGLGPANGFARQWGVTRVPRVFVLDRRGRLAGSTETGEWEALAARALAEPAVDEPSQP
ncbi:MAG: TlpA disulfide reductase family protein [Phycisphaerae bacterium]